jgi:signal transduction histidine kinase
MTVSPLERTKALASAESRAIAMIAGGTGLPDVLDELCRTIDMLTPGVVTTVLLMDADGTRLWPGGGPAFPAVLKPAINPWKIGPDRGACGTAAFLKERVIIGDVTTDPRWPDEYRAAAVSHGLRASWSQPLVTSTGNVLGTFAMYYAEPRMPEAADLELIEGAGQIACIAIQLEQSQAALRESEAALSMLTRRLIEAQEDERTRLARELHDDITPRLALVSMCLDRLDLGADSAAAQAEVGSASSQIGDLIRDIQALSHRLHPAKLELLGLTRAARGLCAEVSDVHDVSIDFQAENVAERLPDELTLCLFRVLQEALQNAIKHSGARRIEVSLRSDRHAIELAIVDAGAGFDRAAKRTRGLGLTSMAERLKLVDGELSINSKPGNGTSVRARVPVAPVSR